MFISSKVTSIGTSNATVWRYIDIEIHVAEPAYFWRVYNLFFTQESKIKRKNFTNCKFKQFYRTVVDNMDRFNAIPSFIT